MFTFVLASFDDKLACQKILDKKGLKGYQVMKHMFIVMSLFDTNLVRLEGYTNSFPDIRFCKLLSSN